MKYILPVIIATLALCTASVSAAEPTITPVPTDFAYPETWHNLALDVTIPSGDEGASDTLNALTARINGTARWEEDITAATLWADAGDAGWQGWGTDTILGSAEYVNDTIVFRDLSVTIPADGLRVFVTLTIDFSVTSQKTAYLFVPQYADVDVDGQYDEGDTGIFTAAGIGQHGQAANTQPLYVKETRIDLWGPAVIVTNLDDGDTVTGTDLTITGQARDQGIDGKVRNIQVGIGQTIDTLSWYDVTADGEEDIVDWSYQWTDIASGQYVVAVQAEDSAGNDSGVITIGTITASQADDGEVPEEEEEEMPAETTSLRDGHLVKTVTGSKVYVISDGQLRWITSGDVFEGLGYDWNNILTVTAEQLTAFPAGQEVTITYRHPEGTLIKYATWPEVFLIEDGYRRHIANEETFLGLGYQWGEIVTVPDWESYPDGEEIRL